MESFTKAKRTIQGHNKSDGTMGDPFLDFTDVGGEGGIINDAVEHLSPDRHVGIKCIGGDNL
jgi:hypothetical protein